MPRDGRGGLWARESTMMGGDMHVGSLLERVSGGGSNLLEKMKDCFVVIFLNITCLIPRILFSWSGPSPTVISGLRLHSPWLQYTQHPVDSHSGHMGMCTQGFLIRFRDMRALVCGHSPGCFSRVPRHHLHSSPSFQPVSGLGSGRSFCVRHAGLCNRNPSYQLLQPSLLTSE